jgi:hypothetical protein
MLSVAVLNGVMLIAVAPIIKCCLSYTCLESYHNTNYGCNLFRSVVSYGLCNCQSLSAGLDKHTSLLRFRINYSRN